MANAAGTGPVVECGSSFLQPGGAKGLKKAVEKDLRLAPFVTGEVLLTPRDKFSEFFLARHRAVLHEPPWQGNSELEQLIPACAARGADPAGGGLCSADNGAVAPIADESPWAIRWNWVASAERHLTIADSRPAPRGSVPAPDGSAAVSQCSATPLAAACAV